MDEFILPTAFCIFPNKGRFSAGWANQANRPTHNEDITEMKLHKEKGDEGILLSVASLYAMQTYSIIG